MQNYGNRTDYNSAFRGYGWKKSNLKPKYNLVGEFTSAFQENFYLYSDITSDEMIVMSELESECGIVFDFSQSKNLQMTFRNSIFKEINVVDMKSAVNISYLFYCVTPQAMQSNYDIGLKRIERLISYDTNIFKSTTFYGCYILEYIGFEGTVASSIDLQWCSLLADESVQKLIDCLKDLAGSDTQTLTLHPDVTLTDEQKATITEKNWTLVQ